MEDVIGSQMTAIKCKTVATTIPVCCQDIQCPGATSGQPCQLYPTMYDENAYDLTKGFTYDFSDDTDDLWYACMLNLQGSEPMWMVQNPLSLGLSYTDPKPVGWGAFYCYKTPSPPPPSLPPTCTAPNTDSCIVNFVQLNNDGVCQDGGKVSVSGGTVDATESLCDLGTDFTDCGTRCSPTAAFDPLPATVSGTGRRLRELSEVGAIEVWASDTAHFFGQKVFTSDSSQREMTIRLDPARPYRYWTLRSYQPDGRLRLDSLRFYEGQTQQTSYTGRRLQTQPYVPGGQAELKAIYDAMLKPLGYSMPTSAKEATAFAKHALASKGIEWNDAPQEPAASSASPSPSSPTSPPVLTAAWWEVLDTKMHEFFPQYHTSTPRRALSSTPAASLATAIAVVNLTDGGSPNAIAAEEQLLDSVCRRIGTCAYSLEAHPILDQQVKPDYVETATYRDDTLYASYLLSTALAPIVSIVQSVGLVCVAADCGVFCSLCREVGGGNEDTTSVYTQPHSNTNTTNTLNTTNTTNPVTRAIEAAFASTDVAQCLSDHACVEDVSRRAAVELGTVSMAMPTLEAATIANYDLFEQAKEEMAATDVIFEERIEGRRLARKRHRQRMRMLLARPPHESKNGGFRRMSEEPEESEENMEEASEDSEAAEEASTDTPESPEKKLTEAFLSMDPNQRLLFAATSHTVELMIEADEKGEIPDHAKLTDLHHKTLRVWASLGGEHSEEEICLDPHIKFKLIKCRLYFSLVGNTLKNRRKMKEQPPKRRKLSEDYKQSVKDMVHENLKKSCCAKYDNGTVHCGQQYCEAHFARESLKRVSKMLHVVHSKNNSGSLTPSMKAVIENFLHTDLHHDHECKQQSENSHPALRRECLAKSLIKHAGARYGFDADTVRQYLKKFGFEPGEAMKKFHKATGVIKSVTDMGKTTRSQFRKSGSEEHARGHKEAAALLNQFRDETRRLQEQEEDLEDTDQDTDQDNAMVPSRKHGFAHAAMHVRHKWEQRGNFTKQWKHHMRQIQRAKREQRRAFTGRHGVADQEAKPEEFYSLKHAFSHMPSPTLAHDIIQADEGSMSQRFGKAAQSLGGLYTRFVDLRRQANENQRLAENRRKLRGRRMAEATRISSKLYEQLESKHGRQLQEANPNVYELPKEHRLSWLHDYMDWNSIADEWTRLYTIFTKRNAMRLEGRSMNEILKAHPTGYTRMDDPHRFSFSRVGDALRRLWYAKTNNTYEHFKKFAHSKHDVAGRHEPKHLGKASRRLEAALGSVIEAPFTITRTRLFTSTSQVEEVSPSLANPFDAAYRYIISIVNCYLVKPEPRPVQSALGSNEPVGESTDGTALKVLRTSDDRLCFPAIPFIIPAIPTFRELLGFYESWNTLSYEEFCYRDHATEFLDKTFSDAGLDSTSAAGWALGLPGLLRVAEGIDSIWRFVLVGTSTTGPERAGSLICGILEFGGVSAFSTHTPLLLANNCVHCLYAVDIHPLSGHLPIVWACACPRGRVRRRTACRRGYFGHVQIQGWRGGEAKEKGGEGAEEEAKQGRQEGGKE